MPEGWIVRALSGYYFVSPHLQPSETVRCRARGIFKKKGITPLVGDRVAYELSSDGEGTVVEIYPRSSELIRPPVANVELAVLVFSVDEPALNLQLLDKFLVHTEKAGLRSIICFTKCDLLAPAAAGTDGDAKAAGGLRADRGEAAPGDAAGENDGGNDRMNALREKMRIYEKIGYDVYLTSAKKGLGLEPVLDRLAGTISVFAGQSGVGKSSLLNALVPGLQLETNEISAKLGRGKHTTRHVELIPLKNGGVVADTPGFSQLDFLNIGKEELGYCFAEFRTYASACRFRGCLHRNEPGCQVVAALREGNIAESRYDHYLQFLDEMTDRKRRY